MIKKLLILIIILCSNAVVSQTTKLIASCCTPAVEQKEDYGRCSGDAYCTACKNCSACKHCSKEGGSCGVCASYAAPVVAKPRKVKAKAFTAAGGTTVVKPMKQYKRLQMLEVTSETLNVRDGAGSNYKVLEVINYGDMVTYISHDGEWLYVRVDESGTNGWVNYKFVK